MPIFLNNISAFKIKRQFSLLFINLSYIVEKVFIIIPPEIINAIENIAGRSGFCLYKIMATNVTPTIANPHHKEYATPTGI